MLKGVISTPHIVPEIVFSNFEIGSIVADASHNKVQNPGIGKKPHHIPWVINNPITCGEQFFNGVIKLSSNHAPMYSALIPLLCVHG
eukprot:TRINITY_DN2898_c0_g1_i1.p3 TRINITY_DN2898_c0_g1~~TRINITY_DN2898_c0_g1_i1.p3  ORF type:complete len:87 (-),score=1.73 TRINITY_DN2898_c0_g1_i1:11-271(-)